MIDDYDNDNSSIKVLDNSKKANYRQILKDKDKIKIKKNKDDDDNDDDDDNNNNNNNNNKNNNNNNGEVIPVFFN
jgi:hypothetical protein